MPHDTDEEGDDGSDGMDDHVEREEYDGDADANSSVESDVAERASFSKARREKKSIRKGQKLGQPKKR